MAQSEDVLKSILKQSLQASGGNEAEIANLSVNDDNKNVQQMSEEKKMFLSKVLSSIGADESAKLESAQKTLQQLVTEGMNSFRGVWQLSSTESSNSDVAYAIPCHDSTNTGTESYLQLDDLEDAIEIISDFCESEDDATGWLRSGGLSMLRTIVWPSTDSDAVLDTFDDQTMQQRWNRIAAAGTCISTESLAKVLGIIRTVATNNRDAQTMLTDTKLLDVLIALWYRILGISTDLRMSNDDQAEAALKASDNDFRIEDIISPLSQALLTSISATVRSYEVAEATFLSRNGVMVAWKILSQLAVHANAPSNTANDAQGIRRVSMLLVRFLMSPETTDEIGKHSNAAWHQIWLTMKHMQEPVTAIETVLTALVKSQDVQVRENAAHMLCALQTIAPARHQAASILLSKTSDLYSAVKKIVESYLRDELAPGGLDSFKQVLKNMNN